MGSVSTSTMRVRPVVSAFPYKKRPNHESGLKHASLRTVPRRAREGPNVGACRDTNPCSLFPGSQIEQTVPRNDSSSCSILYIRDLRIRFGRNDRPTPNEVVAKSQPQQRIETEDYSLHEAMSFSANDCGRSPSPRASSSRKGRATRPFLSCSCSYLTGLAKR